MAEQIHRDDATGVVGRDVKDEKGDEIGHITNVLVDQAGLPRAAVIEVGGFLGVGMRRIAIAWRALDFPTGHTPSYAVLDMTLDQIKATPLYEDTAAGKPITVAAPPPATTATASNPPVAKPTATTSPVAPPPAAPPPAAVTPPAAPPPPSAAPAPTAPSAPAAAATH